MSERETLPERERWERFRVTHLDDARAWVLTVLRPSSALGDFGRYWETMAFGYDITGILWQSAAYFEREADRQHDLAVRWFSRVARPNLLLVTNDPAEQGSSLRDDYPSGSRDDDPADVGAAR